MHSVDDITGRSFVFVSVSNLIWFTAVVWSSWRSAGTGGAWGGMGWVGSAAMEGDNLDLELVFVKEGESIGVSLKEFGWTEDLGDWLPFSLCEEFERRKKCPSFPFLVQRLRETG